MDNLSRENLKRTRAERDLDRFISQDIPAIKKQITEDKKINRPSNITPDKALEKIKYHIGNPHKYAKAIGLLYKLVKRHHSKFTIDQILDCLETIFRSGHINDPPREQTKEIFKFIFEKYQGSLSDEQKSLFEKWLFLADTVNSIHTDDSYVFHNNLKNLSRKLEQLTHEATEWNKIYFSALKSLEKYRKIPWSSVAMQKLIADTYEKRDIFDGEQQLKISEMNSVLPEKRAQEEIIRGPLDAPQEIKDNRDEIIVENSANSWALRQSGI